VAGVAPLLVALVTACSSTTASPTGAPSVTPSPASTPAGSAAPLTPSPTPVATTVTTNGPFVAANVQLTLQPFAQVPGGALAIATAADGRILVATQQGQIWWLGPDGRSQGLALDIADRITSGGERGLLGIALHPGFPSGSARIYVDYTDVNGNTVVASFALAATGGRFDPGSEQVILRQQQPFPNHNGGGIAFGPDGDLYIALGDGGSGGDPFGNGQSLGTRLAKILRVDVDHPAGDKAYSVPADNPFVDRPGALPEIWLYGLRNPFRFSFDRATGDLWIGDVGQDKWEEIDVVRAGTGGGEDFGWNITEGNHCYKPAEDCDTAGLTPPVSEYGHDEGCAVIGGDVYRGGAYPILDGAYLFTDSCSGTIWAIPAATASTEQLAPPVPVGQVAGSPAGFGEDAMGELYIASLDGNVRRIEAEPR